MNIRTQNIIKGLEMEISINQMHVSSEMIPIPVTFYNCFWLIKIRTICELNVYFLGDIKEQHMFVEYLINKCYPCTDYSMASHRLSAFRNITLSLGMKIEKTTHPKKKPTQYRTRKLGMIVMSWIINNEVSTTMHMMNIWQYL